MPAGRRNRLQWADVGSLLHMRLKDAAAELNVSSTYLRRLCRQNSCRQWPGKKIRRSMNSKGKNVMPLEVDARHGSPWAGLAGPSHLAKTEKTKMEEGGITGIDEAVENHPPGEELVTLNLIDKVGSSSASATS